MKKNIITATVLLLIVITTTISCSSSKPESKAKVTTTTSSTEPKVVDLQKELAKLFPTVKEINASSMVGPNTKLTDRTTVYDAVEICPGVSFPAGSNYSIVEGYMSYTMNDDRPRKKVNIDITQYKNRSDAKEYFSMLKKTYISCGHVDIKTTEGTLTKSTDYEEGSKIKGATDSYASHTTRALPEVYDGYSQLSESEMTKNAYFAYAALKGKYIITASGKTSEEAMKNAEIVLKNLKK